METGLKLAFSETPKAGFLATRPILSGCQEFSDQVGNINKINKKNMGKNGSIK